MKYTKENPLRVFTAFSGYDSQCMALDRIGIPYELVGWSEIDVHAIKSHNAVYPQWADRNKGDISKIDWSDVPDFDLFTYSSPCFVAGTLVMTEDGYKKIEDISSDDKVLTHLNRFQPVRVPMVKDYKGSIICVYAMGLNPIRCTPEHPFYVRKKDNHSSSKTKFSTPQWIEAKDLNEGFCYIGYPKYNIDNINVKWEDNPDVFEDGDIIWYPVKSIDTYTDECQVYNMSVEEDESYTANGAIVHNCQDWSAAGLQKGGEEGSGTRSSLLWECRKAIVAKKPKYLLLENVKALTSKKFMPYLQKWIDELESYGYVSKWQVLNSKDYGVPQNRERVFLVSILRTEDEPNPVYHFPKPFPLTRRLKDVLESNVPESYYLSKAHLDRLRKNMDFRDVFKAKVERRREAEQAEQDGSESDLSYEVDWE